MKIYIAAYILASCIGCHAWDDPNSSAPPTSTQVTPITPNAEPSPLPLQPLTEAQARQRASDAWKSYAEWSSVVKSNKPPEEFLNIPPEAWDIIQMQGAKWSFSYNPQHGYVLHIDMNIDGSNLTVDRGAYKP